MFKFLQNFKLNFQVFRLLTDKKPDLNFTISTHISKNISNLADRPKFISKKLPFKKKFKENKKSKFLTIKKIEQQDSNKAATSEDNPIFKINVYKFQTPSEIKSYYYKHKSELIQNNENVNQLVNVFHSYIKKMYFDFKISNETTFSEPLVIDMLRYIESSQEHLDALSINKILSIAVNNENNPNFKEFTMKIIKAYNFDKFFETLHKPQGKMVSELFIFLYKFEKSIDPDGTNQEIQRKYFYFLTNLMFKRLFIQLNGLKYADKDIMEIVWILGKLKLRQPDFFSYFQGLVVKSLPFFTLRELIYATVGINMTKFSTEEFTKNFIPQFNKNFADKIPHLTKEIKELKHQIFYKFIFSLACLLPTSQLNLLDNNLKECIDSIFVYYLKSMHWEFPHNLVHALKYYAKFGDSQKCLILINQLLQIENFDQYDEILSTSFDIFNSNKLSEKVKFQYEVFISNILNYANLNRDKIKPIEYFNISFGFYDLYLQTKFENRENSSTSDKISQFLLSFLNENLIFNFVHDRYKTIELVHFLTYIKLTDKILFEKIKELGENEISLMFNEEKQDPQEELVTYAEKLNLNELISQNFLYLISTFDLKLSPEILAKLAHQIKDEESNSNNLNTLQDKLLHNQITSYLKLKQKENSSSSEIKNFAKIKKIDKVNNLFKHTNFTQILYKKVKNNLNLKENGNSDSSISIEIEKIFDKRIYFDIYMQQLNIAFVIECSTGVMNFKPILSEKIISTLLNSIEQEYQTHTISIKPMTHESKTKVIKTYSIPDYLLMHDPSSEDSDSNRLNQIEEFIEKIIKSNKIENQIKY